MQERLSDLVGIAERLRGLGEGPLAEIVLERCLQLSPNHLPALLALSDVRYQSGDLAAAWSTCLRARQVAPQEMATHFNVVTVGERLGHREEQIDSHLRILEAHPQSAESYFSLAETLDRLGHAEESLTAYRRAVSLNSGKAIHHIHLGYALLRLGHWEEGWNEFSWYFEPGGLREFMPWGESAPRPLLRKGDPLNGKSILVTGWGGLGDLIMFSRLCALLKLRGARQITLHTQEAGFFSQDQKLFNASSEDLFSLISAHDTWVPAAALIQRLSLSRQDVQVPGPYLFSRNCLRKKWQERWKARPHRPRVGIVWSGNPANLYEKSRSIPVDCISHLLERNIHVDWYVLQKNDRNREVCQLGLPHVFDYSSEFTNLEDLAAVATQMQLVISADSMPAHACAALGVPTLLMLGKPADWRWELQVGNTFWYPSMRVYRQKVCGDWGPVLNAVERALGSLDSPREPDRPGTTRVHREGMPN